MAQPQSKVSEILAKLDREDLTEFELFQMRRDLENLIDADPQDAGAYNTLGNVLERLDKPDEAAEAFAAAAQLDPNDPVFLANDAWGVLNSAGPDAALNRVLAAFDFSRHCAESPVALVMLATILLRVGLTESAREVLGDAVKVLFRNRVPDENWAKVHQHLAFVASELGERATALELRARWLAIRSGDRLGDIPAEQYVRTFDWARLGLESPEDWVDSVFPESAEQVSLLNKVGNAPTDADPGLEVFRRFSTARRRANFAAWKVKNG